MAGIFISYRRKDAGGYAGRLHEHLVHHYGREAVFMDIDSIRGGVDFRERIHDALDASDVALVLIGEAWAAPVDEGEKERRIDREDDLVRREVAAALKHEKVTVVPILVEGAALPEPSELPDDLSPLPGLQVCQLRNSEWKADVQRICRAVDAAARRNPVERVARRMWQLPGWAIGLAAVTALAVAIVLLVSGGDSSEGCENQSIPHSSREQLDEAAGSPQRAVEGSVYYGRCGHQTYAMAEFPNGDKDVFAQDGLEWVDLGHAAAEKCDQVPRELLDIWNQNDC